MPLSTFNSRTPSRRDVVVLLVTCVLYCALVEAVTACLFDRVSRIESRRENEYRHALTIRSAKDRHRTSVLVVGNSLLLEGVNFAQLEQNLGPEVELHRSAVENTFYLDWYYGLSRMFRMGSRPDAVVVVLNPLQLTSTAIDGDYSAHFLVDRRDLLLLAKDIGADRNKMSSLALANLSFFYGSRAEIRAWILGRILPDLPRFTRSLHLVPALPAGNALRELAAQRLVQLRKLCDTYGVELVLVIPPAPQDSGTTTVLQVAEESGVRVLVPIAPATLPLTDYADNFHLNSRGAGKFTPALGAALKEMLLNITGAQLKTRAQASSVRQLGGSTPRAISDYRSMEDVTAAR